MKRPKSILRSKTGDLFPDATAIACRLCVLLVALFFFLPTSVIRAQTILVLAPHPDDEAVCCAGVIYNAVQQGETVYVVVLTNGDVGGTSEGYRRETETVNAMSMLGVDEQHIIFLGYGDGSTLELYESANQTEVYTSYAGNTETYANRGLGGTDYHNYLYGTHASYDGANMIQDVTAALQNIHPDEIYTTSLSDGHSDHEAAFLSAMQAIRTIQSSDPTFQPRLHEMVVHPPNGEPEISATTWPAPPFSPSEPYYPSEYMPQTPVDWTQIESLPVPAPMQDPNPYTNLKSQVLNTYQSQITEGYEDYIFYFVKQNEYFWQRTPSLDVALQATVTDSSEAAGGNNAGVKAIDGDIASQFAPIQFYANPSPPVTDREWVTNNQLAGAWIQLSWSSPITVNEVLLSDRPDPAQNVLAGTLTFSDGSNIPVGALPIYGTPYPITFAAKTITWVKFTITQAQGTATGLAEFQVLAPSTPVPIAVTFDPYQTVANGSVQGTVTLSSPNPTGATTVDVGSDNANVSVPAIVTVPAGSTNASFAATVASAATVGQANVTASVNGGTATGIVEIAAPPPLAGISFDSDNVVGGATINCTVALAANAPLDTVVSLASTNSAAQVPANVTISTGTSSTTFSVPTSTVSANTTGAVTASFNGLQVSASLTVTPPTSVSISSISLGSVFIVGGNPVQGSFQLSGAAPAGGVIVNISSDNPAAVPTAIVSVPAGQSEGTFTVNTTRPIAPLTANITAMLAATKQSAPLRLQLSVPSTLAMTATITESSQSTSSGSLGIKAADGIVDGYPGDSTREWATLGQLSGAWITLAWPSTVTISQVLLRPAELD
jgi:LmbE family N-acetylglucosaminyl deacetylase